jgi:putative peptidoglycan lipid II flippase
MLKEPVLSLGYGVLLGGFAQLLLQIPYLSRHGFSCAPDFRFSDPALKRILLLMAPAVFGAAVYQINVLVSTLLASMLPEGSVSYLYYADRLLQFPLGIFAVALGTAALPSFSSLIATKEQEESKTLLAYSLRLMNFITLPAAVGLMVMSVPLFSLLFQRGAFDAQTTLSTSQALVYYSLGLWGASGTRLVVPVFYAMEDTRTPVWVGLWSFILNLFLSLILMGQIAAHPHADPLTRVVAALSNHLNLFSLSHGGLALATSLSSTFNFLFLLLLLDRRLGGLLWKEFLVSFFRSLFNALLMALPLILVVRSVDWIGADRRWLTHGAVFLFLLGLGILFYMTLSYLWKGPEWEIVRAIEHWIRRLSSYKIPPSS